MQEKNHARESVYYRKEKKRIRRKINFGSSVAIIFLIALTLVLAIGGLRYAGFWSENDIGFPAFRESAVCAFFEKLFGVGFKQIEPVEYDKIVVNFITYSYFFIDLYGRYVLIGVLNLLACLCFRRGKTARVNGGNIFLYGLGVVVIWALFVILDISWLDDDWKIKVSSCIKWNIFLLLHTITSFVTLILIHKNRWFESKDERVLRRENGKLHPAICLFAFLFYISPTICGITFVVLLLKQIIGYTNKKQREFEELDSFDDIVDIEMESDYEII